MKKNGVAVVCAGVVLCVGLTGCGTLARVTSNPDGATISLDGKFKGITPTTVKVPEYWDWFSKYSFTADKPGYQPQTIICEEDLFHGAKQAVPGHLHFELVPIQDIGNRNTRVPVQPEPQK